MKSCKTHYYIDLVYNYVHAHYTHTKKHTAGSWILDKRRC